MFLCFGIPMFYVYMLWTFYVHFTYSCMAMLHFMLKIYMPDGLVRHDLLNVSVIGLNFCCLFCKKSDVVKTELLKIETT